MDTWHNGSKNNSPAVQPSQAVVNGLMAFFVGCNFECISEFGGMYRPVFYEVDYYYHSIPIMIIFMNDNNCYYIHQ